VVLEPETVAPQPIVLGPLTRHTEPAGADLSGLSGDTYGAAGVLEVAVGAARLRATPDLATVVACCGDPDDGYASMTMRLVQAADRELACAGVARR
jgi:hypothetical protein